MTMTVFESHRRADQRKAPMPVLPAGAFKTIVRRVFNVPLRWHP